MARLVLSMCLCLCLPSVCLSESVSTFSNVISSQTTKQIEVKFHVEPPWDRGTKVCSQGPGHLM